MKYAIDRIEEEIAILEELNTKEKVEVNKALLPSDITDGTILIYQDNKYTKDIQEEESRKSSILKKFNSLKKY